MEKEFRLIINAPIETAFRCVDEEALIQQWMGGQLTTEFLTARDPENPVGTKFKQKAAHLLTLEGEVIAFEKPRLLGIGWQSSGQRGTIFYNFEPLDQNRTRLSCTLEVFDGNTAEQVILTAIIPLFYMLMEAQLKGLKKLAENL